MDEAQTNVIAKKIHDVTPAEVATWLAGRHWSWTAEMGDPRKCVMAQFFTDYLGTPVACGTMSVGFDPDIPFARSTYAPQWVGAFITELILESDEPGVITAAQAREVWDRLDLSNADLSTGNPQPVERR